MVKCLNLAWNNSLHIMSMAINKIKNKSRNFHKQPRLYENSTSIINFGDCLKFEIQYCFERPRQFILFDCINN